MQRECVKQNGGRSQKKSCNGDWVNRVRRASDRASTDRVQFPDA